MLKKSREMKKAVDIRRGAKYKHEVHVAVGGDTDALGNEATKV